MSGRSLRRRLGGGGAAGIAVALVIAGIGLALLFERHVTRVLSDDLDVVLRQLAGAVLIGPDGSLGLTREPADPRFVMPLSGLYWQVGEDEGGFLASRSLWDARIDLPPDDPAPGGIHRHDLDGPGGQRLLVAERVVLVGEGEGARRLRLVVAADRARVEAARTDFVRDLAPGLALLGLVLAAAAWLQIGLGLAPLAALRRAVARIREGAPKRLSPDAPAEVRPLVEEINALLAAQEAAVARAEARAADLAHGLKTPLAALAGDISRLRAQGQAETAADIEALAEAMRRHIDRALARARAEAHGIRPGLAATLVEPVVRGLVATLSRTPAGKRIGFEVDIEASASLPLERTDLAEALGGLIENAARHARARVRIGMGGGQLAVEDDGAGIAAPDRDIVLRRGVRLDESGGTGLGLAIVQDVLEAYGWSLALDASPLGGLRAVIGRKALPPPR